MQAYVCRLGTCLIGLQDDSVTDAPVMQKLCEWSTEVDALIIGTAFSSPGNLKQLYGSKMDEGKVYHDHKPSESWLRGLLVGLSQFLLLSCAINYADSDAKSGTRNIA